jgi:hypothetical protein
LGPPIGRVASKGGWYVNPPPKMDMARMVAGDARGRLMDCSGIPFLNSMWAKCIELTNTVRPEDVFLTKDQKRAIIHNFHAEDSFSANDETYQMIFEVYGLTRQHEKEYKSLLSSVTKLPCIVDYPPLFAAATKDGVRADSYGDTAPPPEDLAQIPGSNLDKLPIWGADEHDHKTELSKTSCKTCMRPSCQGNEYTRGPGMPVKKCDDDCAFLGAALTPVGMDEILVEDSVPSTDVVIDIFGMLNDSKGLDPSADLVITSSPGPSWDRA